jgi:AraC family transcriptional activator of pobA
MRKKAGSIPVNIMADEGGTGISIERISFEELPVQGESHRHDAHSFFLLEKGTVHIEIDFQKYTIVAPSVIYVHPDQVHRTLTFKAVTISACSLTNENLHPEYLKLLESITPAQPITLSEATFTTIAETVTLCLRLSERKNDKLYHSFLKDGCNALVALMVSIYLEQTKPADTFSRFETVNKAFKEILERNYTRLKRPAAYARELNLSTPYLNECVKSATGHSVSHHIQQRVILEAKRLLVHSGRSVKEIAAALGYDDYPYFSRLFTKVTGITALTFRNKNLD